jgi:hypothetical protein
MIILQKKRVLIIINVLKSVNKKYETKQVTVTLARVFEPILVLGRVAICSLFWQN